MTGIRYLFFVFFLILSPLSAWASPVGSVTLSQGQVLIIRPGQPGIPAETGLSVHEHDRAQTPAGSKLEIRFDDGSIIRIGENSRVEISQYLFKDERLAAKIFLHGGTVRSIVKKAKGLFGMAEETNRFEVHTDTAVIGVRGTDFITFRRKNFTRSIFIKGRGYCYPAGHPEKQVEISENQSVTVNQTDGTPDVQSADESETRKDINDTTIWQHDSFILNTPKPSDAGTASSY